MNKDEKQKEYKICNHNCWSLIVKGKNIQILLFNGMGETRKFTLFMLFLDNPCFNLKISAQIIEILHWSQLQHNWSCWRPSLDWRFWAECQTGPSIGKLNWLNWAWDICSTLNFPLCCNNEKFILPIKTRTIKRLQYVKEF